MVLSPAYPIAVEICFYILTGLAFYAGMRRFGMQTTKLLLVGAAIWTIIIENFIVLNGGYDYYSYATGKFPGYLIWVGVVPLWIILGWFIIAISAYTLTDAVLPGRRPILRSLLTALISLNVDLLLDPVAVVTGLWRWSHPSTYVIGVPLTNWIGWFLIVFVFMLSFELKVVPQIAKGGTGLGPLLPKFDWWKTLGRFLRLFLILVPVTIIATFLVLLIFIPLSNVSGPFANIFPSPGRWWS